MPINLYYLAFSEIPSQKANSVQIMHMCQALSRITDDLTLYCRKGNIELADLYKHYGVTNSFHIQLISVPSIRILDRIIFALKLVAHLRACKEPAVIYSRDKFITGVLCIFNITGLRNVLEVHAPPPTCFWRWWMRLTLGSGRLSYLVAISQSLAKELANTYHDFPNERIVVAHDGAASFGETNRENSHQSKHIRNRKCKIGYVGSLRPGKGMELIPKLASLMPEHEFHVVGGDSRSVAKWRTKADHPNLVFHGFVSPSKTDDYIKEFDILLAPYQSVVLIGNNNINISRWMSPLKIFEYMRMGKPIIASNLPVLREVLEHGHNSMLAEPTNAVEWRDNIRELLNDEQLRSSICECAYNDFRANYTWDRRAEKILNNICSA